MPRKINYIIITVVVLIVAAAAIYFYIQYQNVKQQLNNPTDYTQAQTKEVLEKLGKLMELPTDEIPTVATISDKEKLKNQAFFAKAKNGDKVIIYSIAKKAILYDPIANKIIEVAPINIGSTSGNLITPTPSTAVLKTPTPKPTRQISPTL